MPKPEDNLVIGRSLMYGAMSYRITNIKGGRVYIKNDHHALSIDWMRAVRWFESGIFKTNEPTRTP